MGRGLGLLGGTFDPPHIGHLSVAVEVRHALALDSVLLVVAPRPWQKEGVRRITPAAQRLEMTRAAVEGLAGVEASDVEFSGSGPTYTVETLERLRDELPGVEPHLIIGSDALAGLPSWHRAGDVPGLCRLVVVDRPGSAGVPRDALPAGAEFVEIPALEVSSTDIRERVRTGRPIDVLVPRGVVSLIADLGLYRDDSAAS